MTKYTTLETSKKLHEAFPEWKSDKVWMQGYSTSEMGKGHDDYDSTPPEERNKVHVYDWRVTDNPLNRITTGQEVFKWWYSKVRELKDAAVPAYDTDYLLEKLPKKIHKDGIIHYLTLSAKYGDEFKANYISPSGYLYFFDEPEDDEPVEAFALLALKLKKEGIL